MHDGDDLLGPDPVVRELDAAGPFDRHKRSNNPLTATAAVAISLVEAELKLLRRALAMLVEAEGSTPTAATALRALALAGDDARPRRARAA